MKRKLIIILALLACTTLFYGCSEKNYALPEYDHEALAQLKDGITAAEKAQYDEIITTEVAVIGSDPEGISAAVSAARNGMTTNLIDFERETVGGLYTLGWLNMIDLNYSEKNGTESINQGIFAEVLAANNNQTSFSTTKMEKIFTELLTEAKVDTKTDYSKDYEVLKEGNAITGIVLHDGDKTILLKALNFIDSTQNADISRKAGVEYYDGLEELGLTGERGCDTLVFQLSGVDWSTIKQHLQGDNNDDTGADDASAWGYSEIKNCKITDDDIYMRGPNIGLQEDGTILLNGLQIFNMDIHSEEAMDSMRQRVITTLETELIPYMQANFPGWENVKLVSVAPEFYIRESYHVKTVERLVGEDAFQSNFPESFIASGGYPIDLQARAKGLFGIALYGTSPYGISLGTMVSDKVSNLLIASRCAGYDAIAAGSARTVPVGMALGQGAGAAAAYTIVNGEKDYSSLLTNKESLANIQTLLNSQGAALKAAETTAIQKETAASDYYEAIKYLRGKGLLTCGYSNDYKLTETATREAINSIQYAASSNSPYEVPIISTDVLGEKANINAETLTAIINLFLKTNYTDLNQCVAAGVVSTEVNKAIEGQDPIKNEILYGVMADMFKYMEKAGTTYYTEEYKNLATQSDIEE